MTGGTGMALQRLAAACALAFAAVMPGALCAQEAAPQRVVSVNLCTDQLAMLLAAPGQLVSVSPMAVLPRASAMARQAAALTLNHGRAEEVFLLRPDLVVASSYTAPATLAMLRRLGIRVETFEPAYGLDAIADRMRQMGRALGRPEKGDALAHDFETGLQAARTASLEGTRPRAAHYSANGYSAGRGTLAGEIMEAAGLTLLSDMLDGQAGGFVPLEVLAMAAPDMVVKSQRYPGAARAEDILDHPVLARISENRPTPETDRDWVCGTPFVLRAIARLSDQRMQEPAR
jgi:iron complex transport system substrate-binding protein